MASVVAAWPMVSLGEVLRQRKEFIPIDDLSEYKRCRVQLHTQGVVLRDIVAGAEIKTKSQQVCRAGEFLVAEIDAKVGGYGIVPDSLEGAIVSSHYFLFVIVQVRLDRRFLDFFLRTPSFFEQVRAQGSTNYAAIRPADVLGYAIPLPSIDEQQRIVARIEELAARIEEARGLRRQSAVERVALWHSAQRQAFNVHGRGEWRLLTVEECCEAIIDYRGRTPPIAEAGIPHITSANIRNGHIDWNTAKFVTEDTYENYMTRGIPRNGDVVFTMEAPLGEAAELQDGRRFSLAQRTLLLRTTPGLVTGAYLAKVLASPDVREHIYARATGTTVTATFKILDLAGRIRHGRTKRSHRRG